MEKIAKFSELVSGVSYKDMGGWILSDGATSNRAQIQTPGARGNLAGAPVASWVGWVEVPSTTANNADVFLLTQNASSNFIAWMLRGGFSVDDFFIRAHGSSTSDFRNIGFPGLRIAYAGQRVFLEVRIARGTSDPILRINGTLIAGIQNTGGTPPEWLDLGLIGTNSLNGNNWQTGGAPFGCWLNAHLTDLESETWRITGRPPAWVAAGGSMEQLYLTLNAASRSTETNATTGMSTSNGTGTFTSEAGSRPGGSGSFYAKWTSAGPTNELIRFSFPSVIQRLNRTMVVRFWARASGSGLFRAGLAENNSGGSSFSRNFSTNWEEYILVVSYNRVNLNVFGVNQVVTSTAGDWVEIDDLEIWDGGALSLPTVQPINVLDDATLIGGNQARLLGMTPITTQMLESQIVVPSTAFTTTSVQILGGAITGGTKRRVVSVSGNSSASVNISLGTSSGGTQIVNTQAVNGDFDISTFASRIVAANSSLWVTFSGNTTASITIRLGDIV